MNFFKKLFGSNAPKKMPQQPVSQPDNAQLISLLDQWGADQSKERFKAVFNEIMEGNSFLLLPSVNDGRESSEWGTLQAGTDLKLTSVYDLDGLKVLAVFSDEKALLQWRGDGSEYTSMHTPDLINFCQQHQIDRVVINNDQPNMFVLERSRENIQKTVIEEETEVLIAMPSQPLSERILEKLRASFAKVNTIEEVYQYLQVKGGESSLVLAVKMSVFSENAQAALHHALNNALEGEHLELPLDVMLILTEEWLQTVRDMEGSLFYKR